jgi:hypothetical protein
MKLHEGDMSAKQWSVEHLRATQSKPMIQNESNKLSQYEMTTMKIAIFYSLPSLSGSFFTMLPI